MWILASGSTRAGSRWLRSSDLDPAQPGTVPRPSPESGSDRSYPSRDSSSGVSIAAGSWATGDSRAWSRARTISIEVGMQNSGLAIVLAKQAFPLLPLAPVVGAVSAVMHSLLGSLLAVIWRTRAPRLPQVKVPVP